MVTALAGLQTQHCLNSLIHPKTESLQSVLQGFGISELLECVDCRPIASPHSQPQYLQRKEALTALAALLIASYPNQAPKGISSGFGLDFVKSLSASAYCCDQRLPLWEIHWVVRGTADPGWEIRRWWGLRSNIRVKD